MGSFVLVIMRVELERHRVGFAKGVNCWAMKHVELCFLGLVSVSHLCWGRMEQQDDVKEEERTLGLGILPFQGLGPLQPDPVASSSDSSDLQQKGPSAIFPGSEFFLVARVS